MAYLLRSIRVRVLLAIIPFVMFGNMTLRAQTSLGNVVGTVTDQSGAAITSASIKVVNVATNETRTAAANAVGSYTVALVPAGIYDVTVTAPGFKTAIIHHLPVNVEQTARADFHLHLGQVTETVSVNSQEVVLDTDTSEVGQIVSNRSITELPLNGRDFTQLVQLVPGANPGPPGTPSGAPSMEGSNPESTGYLLDGEENTELFQHHVAVKPSIDVIQEFKVQDKMMSAEFGTNSGGIISVVTKSGTNRLHGGAWDFLRNDALDARSYFDSTKPYLRRNQFGGYIAGPVWIPGVYNGRNRTFFMFNYEGTRISGQNTLFSTVPTDAMRSGDFSESVPDGELFNPYDVEGGERVPFDGNQLPGGMVNSVSAKILALYPEPNVASTAAPGLAANNYRLLYANPTDADQYLVRIDQQFSASDKIFFRYSQSSNNASSPGLLSSYGDSKTSTQGKNAVLNYTHIFSASALNELKAGGAYWHSFNGPSSANTDFNQQYGFESTEPGVPPVSITGFTAFDAASSGGGQTSYERYYPYGSYHLADTFTLLTHGHALKFGFDAERIQMNTGFYDVGGGGRTFTGDYTRQIGDAANSLQGRGLADFMLGIAESIGGLNLNADAGEFRPRFAFYHAFTQDDWTVSKSLTLNLGVRYDLFQPPVTANGDASSYFDFSTGTLYYPHNALLTENCCAWNTARSDSDQLFQGSKNNIAPRVGFAYRIGSDNKTVLRGGFGLFFDPGLLNVAYNNSQSPPFYANTTVTDSPDETDSANFLPITLDVAPLGAPLALPVGFKAYQQKERTGVMQQRTLVLERELSPTLSAAVTYVGWKADHFMVDNPANFPAPGPGDPQARRPYPQFGSVIVQKDDSSSNYNGMTAKIEQHPWKGLSYLASFTWGHGLGTTDTENGDEYDNWNQRYDDFSTEYSNNNVDIRKMFVASGVYAIPVPGDWARPVRFGLADWQLGIIYSARTGLPITIYNAADTLNRGDRSETYADIAPGNPNLPASERKISHWFNTAIFSSPAPYEYGNSRRNIVRLDGVNNVDMSVARTFPIRDTLHIQFRGEFFNLANRQQFDAPDNYYGDAAFGQVSGTVNTGRQVQLALKVLF